MESQINVCCIFIFGGRATADAPQRLWSLQQPCWAASIRNAAVGNYTNLSLLSYFWLQGYFTGSWRTPSFLIEKTVCHVYCINTLHEQLQSNHTKQETHSNMTIGDRWHPSGFSLYVLPVPDTDQRHGGWLVTLKRGANVSEVTRLYCMCPWPCDWEVTLTLCQLGLTLAVMRAGRLETVWKDNGEDGQTSTQLDTQSESDKLGTQWPGQANSRDRSWAEAEG